MNTKYIPDSVFMMCGEYTGDCTVCSNSVYSPVVNGKVHDPFMGKVFCPFGKVETMNTPINTDQGFINRYNINTVPNYQKTTWGRAPQMDPRSLSRIGLSWRSS